MRGCRNASSVVCVGICFMVKYGRGGCHNLCKALVPDGMCTKFVCIYMRTLVTQSDEMLDVSRMEDGSKHKRGLQ